MVERQWYNTHGVMTYFNETRVGLVSVYTTPSINQHAHWHAWLQLHSYTVTGQQCAKI